MDERLEMIMTKDAATISGCQVLPHDADDACGAEKQYTLLGPDRRPYRSSVPGLLGGHQRFRIYGRLDCPAALRAIARGGYIKHRVFFADEQTALDAGYRPCGTCLPEKYRAWRTRNDGGNR
jgi:hypothetical protein